MNTPGYLRGRPAKKLRPRPPQTRRQRMIDLTRALTTHETQVDLFSPARRAHAKLYVLHDRRGLHDALRDVRRALKEIRDRGLQS